MKIKQPLWMRSRRCIWTLKKEQKNLLQKNICIRRARRNKQSVLLDTLFDIVKDVKMSKLYFSRHFICIMWGDSFGK